MKFKTVYDINIYNEDPFLIILWSRNDSDGASQFWKWVVLVNFFELFDLPLGFPTEYDTAIL